MEGRNPRPAALSSRQELRDQTELLLETVAYCIDNAQQQVQRSICLISQSHGIIARIKMNLERTSRIQRRITGDKR